MNILTIFFVALGLAADAFAVSAANGIAMKREYGIGHSVIFGMYFGSFQFVMPILGYTLGAAFGNAIGEWSPWVAFGLLALIGVKMIVESSRKIDSELICDMSQIIAPQNMCMLAIATSIDALAVGVSFALQDAPLFLASGIIGIVAFMLSAVGVLVGNKIGAALNKSAGWVGGGILIAIGLKILAERYL
ncbi:MAG: manganese efflux pump MntP family protein [Clostridiales bacterium]|nr:manganese efflux pump MntP family protein [Clostridiales bacterium]